LAIIRCNCSHCNVFRAGALAALHSVVPASVGLGDFGQAKDCNARQVARWARQYMSSTAQGTDNPRQDSMAQLAQRLGDAAPARDAALTRPHLVHGDFRMDNLVFGKGAEAAVLAVLDWELSTLGDPLSDLAYCCLVRALISQR
jgi:acyl-CoA dehydrogenase